MTKAKSQLCAVNVMKYLKPTQATSNTKCEIDDIIVVISLIFFILVLLIPVFTLAQFQYKSLQSVLSLALLQIINGFSLLLLWTYLIQHRKKLITAEAGGEVEVLNTDDNRYMYRVQRDLSRNSSNGPFKSDFFGPSLSRTVQGTYSDNKMSGNLSIPHNNTFYFILSLTSTNKLHVLAYTENRTNLVFEEYLISNNNNH